MIKASNCNCLISLLFVLIAYTGKLGTLAYVYA